MNLFPYHSETLVSAFSKKEVLDQLERVTMEVNYLDRRTQGQPGVLFNGIIGQNSFRISKVVDKGDTFLPLILGKVEETPLGSIIFLNYRLFPGAIFFLAFWSVILVGIGFYFSFGEVNYISAGICFSLAIANYGLALFFFNRQLKSSQKVFHQLINFQKRE